MKKLGVIANCSKRRAADVLKTLSNIAAQLDLELYADQPTADLLTQCKCSPLSQWIDLVDGVVALGGDGTMLRANREIGVNAKPILGINIGNLGFLTSVSERYIEKALTALAKDEYDISVRSIVEAVVTRDQQEIGHYHALNEVVAGRGPSSRVVILEVTIDGAEVTEYVCDGLIISTPTGSTGYSLSASGPILSPETAALVITPISPHTLTSRPLVIDDKSTIVVTVGASKQNLLLSIDGQEDRDLRDGDRITITRSARHAEFIHLPGHNHYAVLHEKLHWGGSHKTSK